MCHCVTAANRQDMGIRGFARIKENAPAWRYGDGIHLEIIKFARQFITGKPVNA